MKKRRILKNLLRVMIAGTVLGLVTVGLSLLVMARKDKEHERFFNTGKSVNQFLANYKHALEEAFKKQDPSELNPFYSEHYSSPGRGRWVLRHDQTAGDVDCLILTADGRKDFTKNDLQNEFRDYLNGLTSVEDVKFKIDMIEKIELEKSVQLTTKFILDGKDRKDSTFQDRNFYRWHLVNEGGPGAYDWKIMKDELVEGVRVGGDGRDFQGFETRDELASIGIDYKHERDPKLNIKEHGAQLKFGVIEHGGGGVSAVDYNKDTQMDIFFADGRRSRLFRNDGADESGRAHFTDVTKEAGLDGIDQAAAGIFADVDNDGFQDLFVSRYLAPVKFYHNNGPNVEGKITFSDWSGKMGFDAGDPKNTMPAVSACFLDYDRDGYLDLYVGLYGDAFRDVPRLPFFAQNGGANRLYHNEGGKHFTDVTTRSGTGDTGWTLAVAAADYDNDGYPDLADANDFGRKNLYHNNHDGTFTEVAKQAEVLDFSGGMGLTWGDFDDDGYLDLYTSNINSNQRWFGEDMTVTQYARNVIRTKYAITDLGEYYKVYKLLGPRWTELGTMIGEGNRLFHNNGNGTFRQLKNSHTNRAGWSWSVAFFDYDNDSKLDLYAANGWISNAPNTDL
ncbi:MAG TPA: VCBS repeat-containing protein [Pyrinomonadaceae bacterium]|nr:VCBS repeat-containing protein [Pyrinomonadaceae bacterium]